MKKRIAALAVFLLLILGVHSALALSMPVGTCVTIPPAGVSFVLPQDYVEGSSSEAFAVGYINNDMLVGISLFPFPDVETYYEQRMDRSFATEKAVKFGGFDFRWLTPVDAPEITAIVLYEAVEEGCLLELSFRPADPAAVEANEAIVSEIMDTFRSRKASITADVTENWVARFQHESIGLGVKLPPSMMKLPESQHVNDEIAIYSNDYVSLNLFGYSATLDEYADYYGMTDENYYIDDVENNGVTYRVFEPIDPYADPALAYIVAEGNDGMILELVFIAQDIADENENWYYINNIGSSLSFNP